MDNKTILYFLIPSIILIFLSYFIQAHSPLSPDVQYLLHVSHQLLAGGQYGSDIFETNPPMIMYLCMPVCFIIKYLSINLFIAIRLYVLLLSAISLAICYSLLRKIIRPTHKILLFFMFYTLLLDMLFLPALVFGQREHIVFILMAPYLFSAVLALEKKKIHPTFAIIIGLMAGLGFSLKPFFLAPLCLIELYFIFHYRNIFAWIRIETLVIITVFITYVGTIILFQPGYFNSVLPLVIKYYFPANRSPLMMTLLCPSMLFSFAVAINYFFIKKQDRYPLLGTVILLAMIGMSLAFIIPRMPCSYHILPAFSFAWLLLADFAGQTLFRITEKAISQRSLIQDLCFFILLMGIILIIPLVYFFSIIQFYCDRYNQLSIPAISEYINQHRNLSHGKYNQPSSLVCFGLGTLNCFPLVSLIHSEYGSRFPFLWWYRGIRDLEKNPLLPDRAKQHVSDDKKILIHYIVEDFNRYQPQWIIIPCYEFYFTEERGFNIINYLSKNEEFRSAWQHNYRYLTTIQSTEIYVRK